MTTLETALQKFGATFRWRTMKGEILTLDQMDTKHIFNSMKMIFNALAKQWNGVPIWHLQHYEGYDQLAKAAPERLALQVIFFIAEIERRGDLPEKYIEPYQLILGQLLRKLPASEAKLLTTSKALEV